MIAYIPPAYLNSEIASNNLIISSEYEDASILQFSNIFRMQNISMSDNINGAKNRVAEISNLGEDWDGYGAKPFLSQVIKNTYKFIDTLVEYGCRDMIDADNITPTPYGTIEIDLYNTDGLISLEIGTHQIGFFTDFSTGRTNIESNGFDTDFKEIPEILEIALRAESKRHCA